MLKHISDYNKYCSRMADDGRVVFVSSIFRDLVAVSKQFPKPGETIFGSDFFMGFGGKGANQCVMAARMGAETTIVGKVGDDEHGEAYKKNLVEQGVETKHLGTETGISTGIATIFVESNSGENMIVIVPGANARLTAEDVTKAEADIAKSKVVVSILEIGLEAVEMAFTLGRKHGVTTVLNAAPARESLPAKLLENIDVLIVNETEAEILSGLPASSPEEVEACAAKLQKAGCKNIIITLGAEGALVVEGKKDTVKVNCPKLDGPVVDTTGAGDAFVGSLSFFLSTFPDMSLAEAVRRSCAVASISVMKKGTQASYPKREELGHLL